MRLPLDTEHASAANDSRVHRPTLSTGTNHEVRRKTDTDMIDAGLQTKSEGKESVLSG